MNPVAHSSDHQDWKFLFGFTQANDVHCMLPFYDNMIYLHELQYGFALDPVFSSTFLARVDFLQFLPELR